MKGQGHRDFCGQIVILLRPERLEPSRGGPTDVPTGKVKCGERGPEPEGSSQAAGKPACADWAVVVQARSLKYVTGGGQEAEAETVQKGEAP